MSLKKDLTIIFVSFYSKNLIEKPIKQIDSSIPILIIENSLDYDLKKKLESKYSNVKVIIPEKNTGNGGGANIGLRESKTKFVLYLDIDVEISHSAIEKMYFEACKLSNFSILGPSIEGLDYKKKLLFREKYF